MNEDVFAVCLQLQEKNKVGVPSVGKWLNKLWNILTMEYYESEIYRFV